MSNENETLTARMDKLMQQFNNAASVLEEAKAKIEASKKPEPGLTPITRKKLGRKAPKESPKPQPRDVNRKRPLPSPPVKKRVRLGK